jgi:hypothetical protein
MKEERDKKPKGRFGFGKKESPVKKEVEKKDAKSKSKETKDKKKK